MGIAIRRVMEKIVKLLKAFGFALFPKARSERYSKKQISIPMIF